jgi:tRNA pseudouridine13 synthase
MALQSEPDTAYAVPDWPHFLDRPQVSGVIRESPEDFRVNERPLLHPSGDGAHLWLQVEKRCANTDWVAGQLAAAAACAPRDVGYAGMKDRQALTVQWFSVPLPSGGEPDWRGWIIPDVTILEAQRHERKLKRGALSGNSFEIVLRQLTGDPARLERRLEKVLATGVPNYFGPQRFGFEGRNVARGVRWLKLGGRLSRQKRGIYISAVRSFLFNHVLAQRVESGEWNRILDGDIAMLDGSRSLFGCSMPDEKLLRRCVEFDIHPTGPLTGRDGMQCERQAATIEQQALAPYSDVIESLIHGGAKADRRSLRLVPAEMKWQWQDSDLNLNFTLPPGGYATTVLRELVSID